jgi:hypothetical protein
LGVAAFVVAAAVAMEIALPGRAVYHDGWYNVALIALVIIAVATARRSFRPARNARVRAAILAVGAGAAIAGVAGAASGLLAPDNQSFIGAPGARIRVEELGVLVFPLAGTEGPNATVTLERPLHAPVQVGAQPRDTGNFILSTFARDVVYVEASDLRGNHLTVTQPTGSTFLSPVLLMEHRQTLAGMDLPYDSFNVPAARRIVKAVMFTPAQAAMLLHGGARLGEPAVLFAVDDENERPLPNAIALSAGGRAVRVGGLSLRGAVGTYPAVEVVAAPNLLATGLGTLLVLGGLIALIVR